MNDVVAAESRKSPRALNISPNLEALLEHEDRIRQLTDDAGIIQVETASPSAEVEVGEGLPPPPRKARMTRGVMKLGSPQYTSFSGLDKFHDIRKTASLPSSPAMPTGPTTPNPYINPAPTLDDILRAEREVATGTHARGRSTTENGVLRSDVGWIDDHDNNDDDNDRSWTVTRPRDDTLLTTLPRSSIDIDGRQMQSEDLVQRKHNLRQSVSKGGSIPRIEKLLGINRNPFGRLANGATQVFRIDEVPRESDIKRSPGSPKELKVKARRDSSDRDAEKTMQRVVRESVVLDIRREDTGEEREEGEESCVPSVDTRWPRRRLVSHGASSGRWSSGSVDLQSDTTHEPTSTVGHDAHISISSTLYSSSSCSHPRSMYNDPDDPVSPFHALRPAPDDRHSFIDILSPARPHFPDHPRPKLALDTAAVTSNVMSQKPPVPTTPKPIFSRKPGGSRRSSPKDPSPAGSAGQSLPPTTNFLDMDERADLIRKSRKLTQVFGQTPGPDALSQHDSGKQFPPYPRNRHHRAAMSVSNDRSKPVLPPLRPGVLSALSFEPASITGRRHSLPLSPDDMSFLSVTPPPIDPKSSSTFERQQSAPSRKARSRNRAAHHPINHPDPRSRTSFIDLSDDEIMDDGASVLLTPIGGVRRNVSPSTQSLFENMTPEEQADEERRRKREKLAKLHRFLGSRVPPQLILGIDHSDISLPPVRPAEQTMTAEETAHRVWLRRRRSSSAAVFPSTWSDDLAELTDKEKAINVRRAQKMEKVFGVAPPQSLYHTRHSPSPSASKAVSSVANTPQDVLGPSIQRNPNKSSYTKTKSKKSDRPGTAESSQALLPKNKQSAFATNDTNDTQPTTRHSFIYNHYQHSLNSLNDIIDRDDRESLAELHQYLSSGDVTTTPAETRTPGDRRVSNASSIKSERRRSLPARTSMISIASEFSITSPKPEITDFQIRRRRVAKLTQFFGVDYRELINDVLESIEHGLEHERKRGTLRAEEVEVFNDHAFVVLHILIFNPGLVVEAA
ncbi:hypothetical protein BDQ17DRAFT_1420483 [Cyathus striatus]|nr:hypothetical protein BDQ17DRAFT_1420483 [Cyathus striatus]